MSESFGARLRRRREEQQITLATIAEQTKIKQSLLEALERDDISHWPSGIFRRAFVRAYAHAISLDPDVVVREFVEIYPDPFEAAATADAIAAALDAGRGNSGPPTRLRSLFGSAIGSLSRLRRHPSGDGLLTTDIAQNDLVEPSEADSVAAQSFSDARPVTTRQTGEPTPPRSDPPSSDLDFLELAQLCTALAQVESTNDVRILLAETAKVLNAIGLVIWVWDSTAAELRPALAHGYSEKVLAQLPNVPSDADNLTAVSFRSRQPCSIEGTDHASSALVVPMLTPAGCGGVLAIELRGSARTNSMRAAATIIAAQLSQLTGGAQTETDDELLTIVEDFDAPILRAGARA